MFLSVNIELIKVILSLGLAFIIVFKSIPTIVHIAKLKKLCDEPNGRTSHITSIPTLGGLAIIAGILISTLLFINNSLLPGFQYIIAAIIIIAFIGLKDDILVISPEIKLAGQLIASLIIALFGEIRFTSLHGFLGIYEIDYISSIILTVFVIVVFINSFNLIDGIDGLASGVAILCSLVFGVWFYLTGNYELTIIAMALIGATSAFFIYNISKGKNKIFMGDTGALILGLVVAIFAIRFNELNIANTSSFAISSAPAVSFSILIIPLFDTVRVFIIRIYKRKSPLYPDKNHIHHKLLEMGFSHIKATLYIISANIIFIILGFTLSSLNIISLMLINMAFALILSYIAVVIVRKRSKISINEKLYQESDKIKYSYPETGLVGMTFHFTDNKPK